MRLVSHVPLWNHWRSLGDLLSKKKIAKMNCIYQKPWPVSHTVKTVLKGHSKRRPKIGFQDRLSLNEGQKYCWMLQESILQYFWPSLSYHWSLRPLFCLFFSGRLGLFQKKRPGGGTLTEIINTFSWNKLPEVPEYAEMQYYMITSLLHNKDVTWRKCLPMYSPHMTAWVR